MDLILARDLPQGCMVLCTPFLTASAFVVVLSIRFVGLDILPDGRIVAADSGVLSLSSRRATGNMSFLPLPAVWA